MWREISKTRNHGFGSLPSITHLELGAFAQNVGIRISPFKARVVMMLDEFVRRQWSDHRKAREEAAKEEKERADQSA